MNEMTSDALLFFGATGDLAHKKIFPALQRLANRGELNMPVIGVWRNQAGQLSSSKNMRKTA